MGARGFGYPTGAAAAGHGAIKITNLGTVNDLMGHIFSSIAPGHGGAVLKCFRPPLLLDQIVAVTQNAGGELGTLRDQISITFP